MTDHSLTADERDIEIGLSMLPPDKLAEYEDIARHIPRWRSDVLVEVIWTLYGECIIPDDELDALPDDAQTLDVVGREYGLTLDCDPTDFIQMQAIRRIYLAELSLVREMVRDGIEHDRAWAIAIRRTETAGRTSRIKRQRLGKGRPRP